MASNTHRSTPLFNAAIDLAEQGVAIVYLKAEEKYPTDDMWTRRTRLTPDMVERTYPPHANVGIRLGPVSEINKGEFLYVLDVDISDTEDPEGASEQAWAAIRKLIPEAHTFPSVVSGSGGLSRHVYFLSDGVFRRKNIAKSANKVAGKNKSRWEVDFFGEGAQVVSPPSIHPNTKKPYRWVDGDAPDFKDLPFVGKERFVQFFERRAPKRKIERAPEPIRVLREVLWSPEYENDPAYLDKGEAPRVEYAEYFEVICAVAHEYAGTDLEEEAFEVLTKWAQQSPECDRKRALADDIDRAVDNADHPNPVTFGTLLHKTSRSRRKKVVEEMESLMMDETVTEVEVVAAGAVKVVKVNHADPFHLEDNDGWRFGVDGFTCSEGGVGPPIRSRENLNLIVLNDPILKAHLWYDTDLEAPVWRRSGAKFDGVFPKGLRAKLTPDELRSDVVPYDDDIHGDYINHIFEKVYGIEKVTPAEVKAAVMANMKSRCYRSMLELFTRVEWDGIDRKPERFFQDYQGSPEEGEEGIYHQDATMAMWFSVVARIKYPGFKCDMMTVIENTQGSGKDKLLEILFTMYGKKLYVTIDDISKQQDYTQKLMGRAAGHIAEMEAYGKTQINKFKAFITETTDTIRVPYGKRQLDYSRTAILVGTTNDKNYLKDPTGNRRFNPIVCTPPVFATIKGRKVPTNYKKMFPELKRDKYQLWAQVFHMFENGPEKEGIEEISLTSDTSEKVANRLRSNRMAVTADEDHAPDVAASLDTPMSEATYLGAARSRMPDETNPRMLRVNLVTRKDIWVLHMGRHVDRFDDAASRVVTGIMSHVPGWEVVPGSIRIRGAVVKGYRRIGTTAEFDWVDEGEKQRPADRNKRRVF